MLSCFQGCDTVDITKLLYVCESGIRPHACPDANAVRGVGGEREKMRADVLCRTSEGAKGCADRLEDLMSGIGHRRVETVNDNVGEAARSEAVRAVFAPN